MGPWLGYINKNELTKPDSEHAITLALSLSICAMSPAKRNPEKQLYPLFHGSPTNKERR